MARATTHDLEPDADVRTSTRWAASAGMLGGLIGATCCVGPAVGVALGAGSGSFLLAMGSYRPHVFALGAAVAFAAAAIVFARRRRACPTEAERRALRSRWIDAGIVAFAVTYAVGRFFVPRVIELLS
jgi:cytochrome c biogenesis protein CcdA